MIMGEQIPALLFNFQVVTKRLVRTIIKIFDLCNKIVDMEIFGEAVEKMLIPNREMRVLPDIHK